MLAKDLMRPDVVTVGEDESIADLLDVFVRQNIHGAPVLNRRGELVGGVTQQDVYFGSATQGPEPGKGDDLKVKDIMTSPAVSATETTEVASRWEMMYKLKIHRVPILRDGVVTGIVSSLDICGAISRGESLG